MSTHDDHAAMIGRLSVSAVEKSGEVFREASTALKLAQRLDKRSFFVVEDLDVEAVLCGERRLENDAEIVSRGARQDLKLLDEQVGGFRRDAEVPLVDPHVEVLGDGRSFPSSKHQAASLYFPAVPPSKRFIRSRGEELGA